ncbi:VOC family protein [Anaerocolumna jejuensis]|uniref:VOC family protein n=1 Tax=Anaerocolumna jejuensis TaxID=259063 RepID=UPI003F7C4E51
MSKPTINFASVTLDCPNQEELANFYAALLGWNKQRFDEEWLAVISPDKHICLLFQEIEDYLPPVWSLQLSAASLIAAPIFNSFK